MSKSITKDIVNQINNITTKMVEHSFSISENFAFENSGEILWSGFKNISFTLKSSPYGEIYKQCVKEQAYNFIMFDNALIQFMYRIENNSIVGHRLAYLPHPNYINYQDSPEDFEDLSFGEDYFTEIIEKKVISVPIRFDFDNDKKKFVENNHSYSHLTLGNYKDCRIPVNKPISPFKFMLFILRSFYSERFNNYFKIEDFHCKINIEESITSKEKGNLYISL